MTLSHERSTPLAARDTATINTNDRRAFGGADNRSDSINQEGFMVTQHATGRKIWDLLAKLTGHEVEIPQAFAAEKGE